MDFEKFKPENYKNVDIKFTLRLPEELHKEIADYKLIFTKLDETSTLGNIYNLKMYTGASLSYVTCGQNVPDDIAYFSPQATVKQLLGGRK